MHMPRTSAYSLNIGTDSDDAHAIILLAEGALVAVLVQLGDESHGDARGRWIIEATFGLINLRLPDSFPSCENAAAWVSSNICGTPFVLGDALTQLM
jgi:hypothetical protein